MVKANNERRKAGLAQELDSIGKDHVSYVIIFQQNVRNIALTTRKIGL
jgi:hypothetical protein